MKRFLFVAGCARSGTSAFAQLLSGSKDIVIGMERFGHLENKSNFLLTPEYFFKERFFHVETGDTFYDDFDEYHAYDTAMRSKFDSCIYIGDKRPDLYECYDEVFESFPHAIIYFIYRDVREVASSYQGRVMGRENWPATKNFKAAVTEWNRSLFLTREAIKKGYNIKCVDYNSVFVNPKNINLIFESLGLNYGENEKNKFKELIVRSEHLQKNRVNLLSEEEEVYVKENAKLFLLQDIESNNILK
mgnify:CR=1 FL=1